MKNCGSTQNISMINLQRPYSLLQKTSLNFLHGLEYYLLNIKITLELD